MARNEWTETLDVGVKRKLTHLRGFYGDGGENEGVLAVTAVLDPSPHYPDVGRIIVGSPSTSPLIEAYLPNLGGFSCSPDALERLIAVLQRTLADVRVVIDSTR
jgi:hypothetical protein